MGRTECPMCEEPIRHGLETCPNCGATLARDRADEASEAADDRGIREPPRGTRWKVLDGFAGLLIVGFAIVALTEPAMNVFGESAAVLFPLGLFLGFAGLGLLLVGGASVGTLWLLHRVGVATGFAIEEPTLPTGSTWQVTFPDGCHVVQLADRTPRPGRVWCDGRPLRLRWSGSAWSYTDSSAAFEIAGHPARVELEGDWDWFTGVRDPRHWLDVDDGTVQRVARANEAAGRGGRTS